MPMVQCKHCVNYHNSDEWCMEVKDSPDPDRERECEHFLPFMPEELTTFARQLITHCPMLINMFAEQINSTIYNWDSSGPKHREALEPIIITSPAPYVGDVQELLSHVSYTLGQCGYDK